MNDQQILGRARSLLDGLGLHDWQVRLDHARRRAGCCYHQRQTISLSKVLLRQYPAQAIDEVILHEAAHALAGPAHKHDAHWKKTASQIGATPKASLSAQLPKPPAPWVGTCPGCGVTRHLYRAPKRVVSCGSCHRDFDPRFVFRWTLRGRPTTPDGAYRKEFRRLQNTSSDVTNSLSHPSARVPQTAIFPGKPLD